MNFKIVNHANEINLSRDWVDSAKFDSRDRIVEHAGRQYRLIAKKERFFSCVERIGRGLLGIVAVCCSLAIALFNKSIRNLFTKEKEVIRFGEVIRFAEVHSSPIQALIVGALCRESVPCQHKCTFIYPDGQREEKRLRGDNIQNLIERLPPANVLGQQWNIEDHFQIYAN